MSAFVPVPQQITPRRRLVTPAAIFESRTCLQWGLARNTTFPVHETTFWIAYG